MLKTIAYNPKNEIWNLPFLPPIPSEITGIDSCLNKISNRVLGEWKFRFNTIHNITSPYDKCQNYNFDSIKDEWTDVIVPSSLSMQGYNIKNNQEYYYKKTIHATNNIAGARVFVRFEAVYCNARIWLNGEYICTHIGGFTPFDIEITNYLNADNICELIIGIADIEGKTLGLWNSDGDSMSNASWGSYYAHNNICGILRNVSVYYLPKTFILSNHIKAELTDGYTKGMLSVDLLAVFINVNIADIKVSITDDCGNIILGDTFAASKCAKLKDEFYDNNFDINISSHQYKNKSDSAKDLKYSKKYLPFNRCKLNNVLHGVSVIFEQLNITPWTAETPKLYNLTVEIIENGKKTCEYNEKFGFRTIEYGGINGTDKNKIYINGNEIKLRGVCRHDISSKYGRSVTEDEELSEVVSFKNNNINHVRTSHYPASKNYLQLCDQYGIYVELENSVCFKGGNGYELLCSPEEIVQNLSEMVEFYYNHPSVVILSSGNESGYEKSIAFRKSYDYIKEKDCTRPTIFSYPHTVKSKPIPYDILSKHYRVVTKFLGDKNYPKLHDEFAHVACYNLDDIVDDNNFRLFWGNSIMKGWDNMLNDDGALGCAIWGGIDDVFYLPANVESAHQRHCSSQAVGYGEWGCVLDVYKREKPEAYLTKKAFSPIRLIDYTINDKTLTLQLSNRFDHTNLNGVRCVVVDSMQNQLFSGNLPCDIAAKQLGNVTLKLDSIMPKAFDISFYHGGYAIDREIFGVEQPQIYNDLKHKNFEVADNMNDIQLKDGNIAIAQNLTFLRNAKPMKPKSRKILKVEESTKKIVVKDIFSRLKHVTYEFEVLPEGIMVRVVLSPVLRCCIGEKFALGFDINHDVKAVSWDKNCDLTYYPPDHLERKVGRAVVSHEQNNYFGIAPEFSWKDDGCNYFTTTDTEQEHIFVTNDFKTTRTDINLYDVELNNSIIRVAKVSERLNCYTSYAREKCYIDASDNQVIKTGSWHLIHKNSMKQCVVSRKKTSTIAIEFSGVGIRILGTRSKEQGKISLYIDNQFCRIVNTRSDICDVLDFMVLDTVADLNDGKHALSIVLNDDDGVRISGFEVITTHNLIKSRLTVGVGGYYRSLAWGNYYGKRMSLKQKKGFSFMLTHHAFKENQCD